MKRELFQNVLAIPCKSGDAVNREGYLSAVIGVIVGSGGSMTLTVEHSDDGETFVPVTDERVFPEKQTKDGKFAFEEPVGAEDDEGPVDTTGVVNVDVDLIGLKRFVKFTVEMSTEGAGEDADKDAGKDVTEGTTEDSTAIVVVLGDNSVQPV